VPKETPCASIQPITCCLLSVDMYQRAPKAGLKLRQVRRKPTDKRWAAGEQVSKYGVDKARSVSLKDSDHGDQRYFMDSGGGIAGVGVGVWRHHGILHHTVVSGVAILRHRIIAARPATFYHAYPFYSEPPVPTSQQR
jgi:hypothetical protein